MDKYEELLDEVDKLKVERDIFRANYHRMCTALRIIAGREQCIDNLMSNVDVACEALDK